MTVCIAAIFRWIYEKDDVGWAVLAASDRMLTNDDVEYEPPQTKLAFFGKKIVLLTAGSVHIHSEAIRETQKELLFDSKDDVRAVAEVYASKIRFLRSKFAADRYLSPFGLDIDRFVARQREMSPEFVRDLSDKMNNYAFDIEAIVAGMDDNGAVEICHVDGLGTSTCHSDVGFISIGIGSGHANLQFMSAGYTRHRANYYAALGVIYAAKKRAEAAPGVGKSTDIVLITRAGTEAITDENMVMLQSVFDAWEAENLRATFGAIEKIQNSFANYAKEDGINKTDQNDAISTDDFQNGSV